MRQSLFTQTLLHLPSLSFLLLLAAALFLLPQKEILPPLPTEAVASDIVWSRRTEAGEVVRMSAAHLRRQVDGIVLVEDVKLDFNRAKHNVQLRGPRGKTDDAYTAIYLEDAHGELVAAAGQRITLQLAGAHYALDGTALHGIEAQIRQRQSTLSGDKLIWRNNNLRLQGNVRASFQ